MRYADIKECDINNGDGIVVSLWVTGCPIKCFNCHNESIWDRNTGKEFTDVELNHILDLLSDPRADLGLSVLGGEPLAQWNYPEVLRVVKTVKNKFPNKRIWLWTGMTYEHVKHLDIMNYLDVIIDGQYIDTLKDTETWWRGSSNQRKFILK